MRAFLATVLLLAAGCACEHGIGLSGDQDTDQDSSEETSHGSWDPPIENLGEPGWRESTEPLCPGVEGEIMWFDLWSYSGGVYIVLVDSEYLPGTSFNAAKVFFNDGSGWAQPLVGMLDAVPWYEREHCFWWITGTPSGVLFSSCGDRIVMVDSGEMVPAEFDGAVFVVADDLAYACAREGLLRWDGEFWTRLSTSECPGNGKGFWADENVILRVGEYGILHSYSEGEWSEMDTTIITGLSSLWAFSSEDIWVGADSGQLIHYDGTGWTSMDWPNSEIDMRSIRDLWGSEGFLYIATTHQFVIWDGSSFSVLGYWEGSGIDINEIWGNSPEEVFLAVIQPRTSSGDCGPEYLLRWDGHEFHWF